MPTIRPVTIGVASARTGVPEWRLRAWEKAGLLRPERSASGYRLYSASDLELARRLAEETAGDERLSLVGLKHVGVSALERSRREPAEPVDAIEAAPPTRPTRTVTPETGGRPAPPAALRDIAHREPATRESPLPPRSLPRVSEGSLSAERELRILRRVADAVRYSDGQHDLLTTALEAALEATGAYIGALSSADFTRQQYIMMASVGLSESYLRGVDSWRLHEGLAGRSFGMREPLVVDDLQGDRRVARGVVHEEGLRAYVCVPLLRGQRRLGILEVFARTPGRFDSRDVAVLELVAAAVAPVLHSADLERRVDSLQEERSRTFREWAAQLANANDAERRELSAKLRETGESWLSTGADIETAAAELTRIAQALESRSSAFVDLAPIVRSNVTERLTQLYNVDVSLDASTWPVTLPSALSSRLYLIILALAEEAAPLAASRIALRLASDDTNLVIEIGDDRDTGGRTLRVVPAHPDVLASIQNLGGTIELASAESGDVRMRVTIPRTEDPLGDSLTARERAVLEALRKGVSNRELAIEFGISPKTLQNHLTALYRKLDVTSRAEAIRYADRSALPRATYE